MEDFTKELFGIEPELILVIPHNVSSGWTELLRFWVKRKIESSTTILEEEHFPGFVDHKGSRDFSFYKVEGIDIHDLVMVDSYVTEEENEKLLSEMNDQRDWGSFDSMIGNIYDLRDHGKENTRNISIYLSKVNNRHRIRFLKGWDKTVSDWGTISKKRPGMRRVLEVLSEPKFQEKWGLKKL